MSFIFPFSTCEKCNEKGFIKQPVSAFINFITVIILLIAITYAKTLPLQLMLLSYACFEIWHTFSHIRHIPGTIQTNVVHILGYAMSFATLYVILTFSKSVPGLWFLIFLITAIIIDIYITLHVKGVYTVFSGLLIFVVIVLGNLTSFPSFLRTWIPVLIIFLSILFALFWNEAQNCKKMMDYKVLPYHAMVEIIGLILFTQLAWIFLCWENKILSFQ